MKSSAGGLSPSIKLLPWSARFESNVIPSTHSLMFALHTGWKHHGLLTVVYSVQHVGKGQLYFPAPIFTHTHARTYTHTHTHRNHSLRKIRIYSLASQINHLNFVCIFFFLKILVWMNLSPSSSTLFFHRVTFLCLTSVNVDHMGGHDPADSTGWTFPRSIRCCRWWYFSNKGLLWFDLVWGLE